MLQQFDNTMRFIQIVCLVYVIVQALKLRARASRFARLCEDFKQDEVRRLVRKLSRPTPFDDDRPP